MRCFNHVVQKILYYTHNLSIWQEVAIRLPPCLLNHLKLKTNRTSFRSIDCHSFILTQALSASCLRRDPGVNHHSLKLGCLFPVIYTFRSWIAWCMDNGLFLRVNSRIFFLNLIRTLLLNRIFPEKFGIQEYETPCVFGVIQCRIQNRDNLSITCTSSHYLAHNRGKYHIFRV